MYHIIPCKYIEAKSLKIEEVHGVTQVLDQEEEIAMKEFVKFEEKLKLQKEPAAATSPIGIENSDILKA